jgi:acetyl-CoA acetyltransferase
MSAAYVYEAVRTAFGRYGGALAGVRPDDLAAQALQALLERVPALDPMEIDDVLFGNVNGAGEDNRNVARMAVLLTGLPTSIPGATINRLCGSSLEAAIQAKRAIECGEAATRRRRAGRLLGRDPLARVVSRAVHAVDPEVFGIAPVEAVSKALGRAGISWDDVDAIELNEAFASQSLACLAGWPELDPDKVNARGGAIAIGHPLGASGARILGRLAHELHARGGGYGAAAVCIGVGRGLAVVLEGVGRSE